MAKITANHQLTIHGTNTRQTLVLGVSDFFVLNGIEARKAGALLDTPDLSFYMTKDGETKASGRFTLGNEIKFPIGDVVDLITVWVAGVDDADIVYNIEVSYGQGSFNDLTTISYNKDLSLIAQATQKTALNQNTGLDWKRIAGERVGFMGDITFTNLLFIPNNKKFKKIKAFAIWSVGSRQEGNHADITIQITNNAGTNAEYNEIAATIGIAQQTESAVIVGDNSAEIILDDTNNPSNYGVGDYYTFSIFVQNFTGAVEHSIQYQVFAIIEDA